MNVHKDQREILNWDGEDKTRQNIIMVDWIIGIQEKADPADTDKENKLQKDDEEIRNSNYPWLQ